MSTSDSALPYRAGLAIRPAPDAGAGPVPGGLPRIAGCLAEGAALFGLAWALQAWAGVRVPGLDLLWVPVILLAARYGYWPGLLAGAAAGFATVFPAIADPAWRADLVTHPQALAQAVALVLGGALLGELRGAQDRKLHRARADAADLADRLATLEQHYGVIERAKFELDRRVVGQTRTVAALYRIALALDTLDRDAVLPAALGLLERLFDVKAAAVYSAGPGGTLSLAHALGTWPGRPDHVAAAGLWRAALETGSPQVARAEGVLQATGALALLPVRGGAGTVAAVVAIEEIPLSQLTPTNLRLFETIADWAARALARAEAHGRCFAAIEPAARPAAA
ncbi:MAG: GAF domain-containing protein [Candidatus Sericytochromatia bacterium]|nr:GAF domain-containing protein [Candidatus Tanganyikabacteria bacterium]